MPVEIDRLDRSLLLKLLEIKDSDIRIATLYYGGSMELDIADPTRIGQDIFVLSKGHAVATLASLYADLGYFPADVLDNSRSPQSILKGHPGPTLPGVQRVLPHRGRRASAGDCVGSHHACAAEASGQSLPARGQERRAA